MKSNFCIAPWSTLYKHTDNSVRLCCVDKGDSLGSLHYTPVDELRNNEEFKKVRRQFLNNERPERCKNCWDNEDQGIESYRMNLNNQIDWWFEETPEFTEEALPVKNLDFRPSNLCNLACKSCNPIFSSKLVAHWREFNWIDDLQVGMYQTHLKTRVRFQDLEHILKDVKSIYFAGGEPMIADDHWYILKKLVENNQKDVGIVYNTNLTTLDYKEFSVDNYWDKFHSIHLMSSIDAYGKMFEYIRTGGKWNDIVDNLKRASKIPSVHVGISATIGWLNLLSVFKLFKFVIDENLVTEYDKLNLNIMMDPPGSGIHETPDEVKEEIIVTTKQFIEEIKHLENIDKLISQLNIVIKKIESSNFSEENFKHWINVNKKLDSKYNLNLFEVLPFKSEKFIELCKKYYNAEN